MGLRLLQAFEAETLQRRLLGVAYSGFDLALSIRIRQATRQRDGAVMLQHIPVEGIERGIVDVGGEHALAQVIEHNHKRGSSEPAKSLLMQFGPDLRTGTKYQQANGLAAVAQRHHEQPRAPVLTRERVADH